MNGLPPAETIDVEKLSPIVWRGAGEAPAFVFDVDRRSGFACFLLQSETRGESPTIKFDQGSGFTDLAALSFKSFPFAFYHLPVERIPTGARLMFVPCSRPGTFRFVSFQTSNAILVAVLHYLFNLRYQKIGLVDPSTSGAGSRWATLKASALRIFKFFRDVSGGRGLRVQEGSETWAKLKLAMSLKAVEVEADVAARLAGRSTPLISFVSPTYETSPAYLRDLADSFALQNVPGCELVLTDDGSKSAATRGCLDELARRPNVRVVFNPVNRGIAASTNAGIDAARGEWIAFIDHDDVMVAGAAAVIADAIMAHPDAAFFYTDELIVDAALRPTGAFCKPAYDSVLLSGTNYINHFSIFRRDRVEAMGRLREDREGSQDYDLLLRYLAGLPRGAIVHIPYLAYLWRREETTYSHRHLGRAVDSARTAIADAFSLRGQTVGVEGALDPNLHRVRFRDDVPAPRVSVVIPNRDNLDLVTRIVRDLRERTTYDGEIEIVIVDNGTTDANVLAFYETLRATPSARVDIVREPFNFARMCNRGAALASGNLLLFLNNDIEVVDPGWLSEMVECLRFEETGIVGARLLYPNGLLQHAGVIAGLGGAAGHWYIACATDEPGPMGRLFVRQTLGAVTGACMLVTRDCFEALQGFDEEAFAIAYNDVDFCLRARERGFRTVWTPFATLVHHESLSRGSDETGANAIRFKAEMARLRERHGTLTLIDDAFSPFYDRGESKPLMIVPDALPTARANHFT